MPCMVSVLTFSNKIESVLTKLLNQYNSTAHHSIALRNHGFLSPCIQEVNIFILSHHDKLLNNRITNIDRALQLPELVIFHPMTRMTHVGTQLSPGYFRGCIDMSQVLYRIYYKMSPSLSLQNVNSKCLHSPAIYTS
jgi:hypothetical protein